VGSVPDLAGDAMSHPADLERSEELRSRVEYAAQNLDDARQKVLEAHKDYEHAQKEHGKAVRDYLEFMPAVEG